MINRMEVERIKKTYLPGMRIRLLKMDDTQAPPIGTEGIVLGVDDVGSVIVMWDKCNERCMGRNCRCK